MSWWEAEGVFYCFGLARNDRLQAQLEKEFKRLREQIARALGTRIPDNTRFKMDRPRSLGLTHIHSAYAMIDTSEIWNPLGLQCTLRGKAGN